MAAYFPTSVRPFVARVDLVDTVIADNVNSLQEEVKAIETTLGTAASVSPIISTWTGTFSTGINWTTLGSRLANIEAGLVNGVDTAPYVFTTGGSTIASSAVNLTLKTSSGTSNTLEVRDSSNVLGFNTDYAGQPKVGTANVVYVNSTDYTNLTTATAAAVTLANTKIPLSTVTAAGDLIVGTGSGAVTKLAKGTNGQSLIMSGTAVAWGTPTDTTKIPLATVTAAGDIIVGSGNAAVSRLGIGTSGYYLTSDGTTPAWTALPALVSQTNGTVTTASISSGVVRNTYVKTTAPSGSDGAVGDIWIVYA
jgi:sporulation protein YlmC with PRC-barrel domain